MSWTTDDGLHEGYLLPELGDGQQGLAIVGGGVPLDQVIVGVEYDDVEPRYDTRPAAEVVGWRVMCDCRSSFGSVELLPEGERWRSQLLARAAFPAQANLARGRIFAADEDVTTVEDRDLVAVAVHTIWRTQHVAPLEAVREVERARTRLVVASSHLERALEAAVRAGVDEQTIGHAAWHQVISRQPRRVPDRSRAESNDRPEKAPDSAGRRRVHMNGAHRRALARVLRCGRGHSESRVRAHQFGRFCSERPRHEPSLSRMSAASADPRAHQFHLSIGSPHR